MRTLVIYAQLMLSMALFIVMTIAAFNHELSIYLLIQARGQAKVLFLAINKEEYIQSTPLTEEEIDNLERIEQIKKFSVDSLGFEPTANYCKILNDDGKPLLWVVTAAPAFKLTPVEWNYPLIGKAGYKGFFSEDRAIKLKNHLIAVGFDAAIRPVSAWSTLGWLPDPLPGRHLKLTKGKFCNLLFHELFHATFFKADNINNNENLANFVADQATQRYLMNDSTALLEYLQSQSRKLQLNNYLKKQALWYRNYLDSISNLPNKELLKQQAINYMYSNLKKEKGIPEAIKSRTQNEMMTEQNAFFVDYIQYESKQDSLLEAFNKIYKGSLKLMVQSLKE